MYIFIDYDPVKDRGIIKSDYLSNIREHFSVEDDKANIKKHMYRKFDRNRYIPTRRYIITETGRFDMGLLAEIIKFFRDDFTILIISHNDRLKDKLGKFSNTIMVEQDLNWVSTAKMVSSW